MSNGFAELQRQPTRYGCHGQGIVPATTAGFNFQQVISGSEESSRPRMRQRLGEGSRHGIRPRC